MCCPRAIAASNGVGDASMSFRSRELLQEVRYNRTKIKQIKTTMPIQKMISAADGSLAEGLNLSSNRTANFLIDAPQ